MKFSAMLIALLILSLDTNGQQTAIESWSSAIQLQVGNYWVYESAVKQIDSKVGTNITIDSVFIREDTVVRGSRFYHLENMYGLSEWKRDSSGFLTNLRGEVQFSPRVLGDTLMRTGDTIVLMCGETENVTVPAGKFVAAHVIAIQKKPAGVVISKKSRVFYNEQYVIVGETWHAKGVGVVRSIAYYASSNAFEKSLLKFYVK
ncbi:hypothetical protein WBG78_28935 [Chryseolinea sp. T2]|uniref:hypothetical protein n=1 Tax=Chryseolinea sp. T2 TaxID=3129255 RepID=UPI0030769B01